MTQTRRTHLKMIGTAAFAATGLGFARVALAQDAPVTHEIQMLNKGIEDKKQVMVFSPDLVRAKPGDTIKFVPTDKGHFAVSAKDHIPAGAEEWKGKMNEVQEIVVTVEGAYAYNCTPHGSIGMVGLVLVGNPAVNYEELKAFKWKGKAKERYADIFARADAMLAAEPPVAG